MLLFLIALAAHAPLSASRPTVVHRYRQGGWTLLVQSDRFSGAIRCTLDAPHIVYQPGAVGFRTRAHAGIDGAWYALDNGAARPWTDLYPTLLASNARLETDGLDDPTGGIVWLPDTEIERARLVTVETLEHGRGRLYRFRLRGFVSMRAAARRLGCPFGPAAS